MSILKRKQSHTRGFSILESMIAAVLMLIFGSAVATLLVTIRQNAADAKFSMLAYGRARSVISVVALNTARAVGVYDCTAAGTDELHGPENLSGMAYRCTVTVSSAAVAPAGLESLQVAGTSAKFVRVSVRRLSGTREYIQDTYVY
jgi:type II secretory pathway pseudopilin PulG